MRIRLICNAASGSGTDSGPVEAGLRAHGAELVDDDPERVVVAGGDGTVGEGAELAARLGVPLAVIPTGTANDFARATGLPLDRDRATALAATGTATRALELGRANGRPFLNAAAAGLSPEAARRADPLKRYLGPGAYPVGAALAALRDPAVRTSIHANGALVFDDDAWQVMVLCTGAFGGGARIDAARPADGRLDLVVVPAVRRVALARMAAALRRGDIADWKTAQHVRADELVVEVPAGVRFNVDGELVDLGREVRFTAEAGAVALVTCPQ